METATMVQVPESMDSVATVYSSSSIVQIVYLLTNPENRDAILKKSNVVVQRGLIFSILAPM
jgi:hypothetical protein